jgi:predicted TIM-barrel fold metal-dependent hydrolase
MVPGGDRRWVLPRERFQRGADPDLLGRALFAESDTDACIYHGTPLYGIYRDGGSPLWVGRQMRDRWPDRVALYGPVSPWQPDALETVERLIAEDRVEGIKLYPMDLVDGEVKSYRLDDPEIAFPILERARALGVKLVATHKSLPQGQVPSEPFAPWDVSGAASAFPDLTFEIVHGGLAYLEEVAFQVQRFPNVCVNLENSTSFLLVRQPRKFAHLIGQLLFWGGEDRIFWSSGAIGQHPRPLLECFWDFEIPEDMQADYGYPPLTEDIKRRILGLNHARLLGWDVDALRARLGSRERLAEPWSAA